MAYGGPEFPGILVAIYFIILFVCGNCILHTRVSYDLPKIDMHASYHLTNYDKTRASFFQSRRGEIYSVQRHKQAQNENC